MRILVADDEPQILRMMCRVLSPHYDVHTAADGLEALALADRVVFDLAVLDVQMPGCSGIEVARQLLGRLGSPSVLLASGVFADPDDSRDLAVPDGVFACLAKPFDPGELLDLLDRAARDRQREV
jgi:CheY-like chemotaxis protein